MRDHLLGQPWFRHGGRLSLYRQNRDGRCSCQPETAPSLASAAADVRKPNSVPRLRRPSLALRRAPAGLGVVTIIPLAPPSLAGSSSLPGSFGRAVLLRFPIWPCSVRGFACHPCCHGRGALLPHLFTLTRLRPLASRGDVGPASHSRSIRPGGPAAPKPDREASGRRRAVYFLCHFPSSCPDRALPGALPCGVRTFLPPSPASRASARRAHPDPPVAGGIRRTRRAEAREASEGGRSSGHLRRRVLQSAICNSDG